MKLVIIDYGSGNLRSAAKACERALSEHAIQGEVIVSSDARTLQTASHIILPGVGAFGDCMQGLQSRNGLLDALSEQVLEKKRWFLGICVGMQLLFERGFEHGTHAGLGWLKGEVVKLSPSDPSLKIPHMGWNQLQLKHTSHPLFQHIISESLDEPAMSLRSSAPCSGQQTRTGVFNYFVHSYHAKCANSEDILATTDYGGEIVAAVGRANIFGTQFHPEKSQAAGLSLLANFMKL
jgi:glutamine amidotransferase